MAVHENVLALYRLLDEVRRRHPGVEIEDCAGGGGRVDLGILERTDRIWTSDVIDPVERLPIQKYTGLLVPLELMGMHVGSARSKSTGRRTDLPFRATSAIFGHFGVEWDITAIAASDLDALAGWIAIHKTHRGLFHSGTAVHADLPDATMDLRGVVAADRSGAVFAFTQVTSSESYPPGPIRFPGLDDDRRYRVRIIHGDLTGRGRGRAMLGWQAHGLVLGGRVLRTAGVQPPVLRPENVALIELSPADEN